MNKKKIPLLLHVAFWIIVFLAPLSFVNNGNGVNLMHYLMGSMAPLMIMLTFYTNFLWLTPCYFVKGDKRFFFTFNVLMILVLGLSLHYWMTWTYQLRGHSLENITMLQQTIFVLRDMLNLAIAATVATAICLAIRWQHTEEERLAAVAAHADAELRNLRSQINPHFLLNTLNNIYALTTIDTVRAQTAIEQLSKLLRHMLYDNQEESVRLADEIQFLENYVNLMKIRLANSIEVTFEAETTSGDIRISPLLFISLIENAFKHGVSPTEHSYIHISIKATSNCITCNISNSNHPKSATDHSGHGIGLQQVKRRLELAYPDHYTWEQGVSQDQKDYQSIITIRL